jgi:hypothetical protein
MCRFKLQYTPGYTGFQASGFLIQPAAILEKIYHFYEVNSDTRMLTRHILSHHQWR